MNIYKLTNPIQAKPIYVNFDLVTQFKSWNDERKCIGTEIQFVTGKWIEVSEQPDEIMEILLNEQHV